MDNDHDSPPKKKRLVNGYSDRHWRRKVQKETEMSFHRINTLFNCSKLNVEDTNDSKIYERNHDPLNNSNVNDTNSSGANNDEHIESICLKKFHNYY